MATRLVDARASKIIEASRGAEIDPLAFYGTAYSTTHGVSATAASRPTALSSFTNPYNSNSNAKYYEGFGADGRGIMWRSESAGVGGSGWGSGGSDNRPWSTGHRERGLSTGAEDGQAQQRRADVAGINPATGRVIVKPRQTGYSKNVSPHVEYSKKVDENETFHIDEPFATKYHDDYLAPSSLPRLRGLPSRVSVADVLDSGFTRKYANNRDKSEVLKADQPPQRPPVSTTTDDFRDFSGVYAKRIDGRVVSDLHGSPLERWRAEIGEKTSTAYTSDAAKVHRFGTHDEFRVLEAERARQEAEAKKPPAPRQYNVNHVDLDGFTRRDQVVDYIRQPRKALEAQIRKIGSVPDSHLKSVTHTCYQKPTVVFKCLDKHFAAGPKQSSGALRNLPEFPEKWGIRDADRFKTVASESYKDPSRHVGLAPPRVPAEPIPNSGYTKGNNTIPPMDPNRTIESFHHPSFPLHPTVARAEALRNRGLYQTVVLV